MNRSILTLLGVVCAFALHAQDFNNYVPLKSQGSIPKILTQSYKEAVTKATIKDESFALREKKEFIMMSRIAMQRLLLAGRILVNDTLGKYVSRVADKMLEHDPETRRQLHFFVDRSPVVNARCLDNGIILVNAGLIAQLDNEAQLAAVLAHEISHFKKRHQMDQYVLSTKMEKNYNTYHDAVIGMLGYSKDHELEADKEGFNLIKQSPYDPKVAMSVMDVLKYSYLPFEEMEFDKAFLEEGGFRITDVLFPSAIAAVKNNDDYDDSKSSHPNIRKRREKVKEVLAEQEGTLGTGTKFVVASRDVFRKLRTIARFETAHLYLIRQDYPNAIYASYILQKEYPSSSYLKAITAKALYNLAVYRSPIEHTYGLSNEEMYKIPDYKEIEGESQQLYYIINNLDPADLTTLALVHALKMKNADPGNATYDKMCDNLLYMLAKVHGRGNGYYMTARPNEEPAAQDSTKKVDPDLGKYEVIKVKQMAKTTVADPNKYALVSWYERSADFKTLFDRYLVNSQEMPTVENRIRQQLNYGKSADTVIVFAPQYNRIEVIKNGRVRHYPPEQYDIDQAVFRYINWDAGADYRVKTKFINTKLVDSLGVDFYNEMTLLADLYSEISNHSKPLAMSFAADESHPIRTKYGRFMQHSYARVMVNNPALKKVVPFVALFPPLTPFMIAAFFHKAYDGYYSVGYVDLKTGRLVYSKDVAGKLRFPKKWVSKKVKMTLGEYKLGL